MASSVESKCKVRSSNQVSKHLELTMTNETMSKAFDKTSVTVKDQEMFGRATSLAKKEASDEIAMSLERRLKSELERAKRDRSRMFESRRIEFVKKKAICNYCHNIGHKKRDCPHLGSASLPDVAGRDIRLINVGLTQRMQIRGPST